MTTFCPIKNESDEQPSTPSILLRKRKTSTATATPEGREYIYILSDDSESHSQYTTHKKSKRRKNSHRSRGSGMIDLTATPVQTRSESPSDNQTETVKHQPVPVRKPIHIKAGSGNAIRITKKDSVERIEHLDHVPAIWNVSLQPTAFLIDLSDNSVSDQPNKSIISLIRHDVSTMNLQVLNDII